MGLFNNLARIALAPVQIVDSLVVEPIADIAETIADDIGSLND